jgi:hypothetical protein
VTVYLNDPVYGANPTDPVANAAALAAAAAAALATDNRRLVITGGIYDINAPTTISGELQVYGENQMRHGLRNLNPAQPHLIIDGGAVTELGFMSEMMLSDRRSSLRLLPSAPAS